MLTEPCSAIVDFLIAGARSRSENCSSTSAAIFDELDSLSAEEFALVYTLYLLGSGETDNRECARQIALAAEFAPLASMANDINLHIALTQGRERWHAQTDAITPE